MSLGAVCAMAPAEATDDGCSPFCIDFSVVQDGGLGQADLSGHWADEYRVSSLRWEVCDESSLDNERVDAYMTAALFGDDGHISYVRVANATYRVGPGAQCKVWTDDGYASLAAKQWALRIDYEMVNTNLAGEEVTTTYHSPWAYNPYTAGCSTCRK
jgi:hypothetical protein